jgi:hypothetical protein
MRNNPIVYRKSDTGIALPLIPAKAGNQAIPMDSHFRENEGQGVEMRQIPLKLINTMR